MPPFTISESGVSFVRRGRCWSGMPSHCIGDSTLLGVRALPHANRAFAINCSRSSDGTFSTCLSYGFVRASWPTRVLPTKLPNSTLPFSSSCTASVARYEGARG